jgi:peptidoglycan/LPS O-acetylase OafA/YrhL
MYKPEINGLRAIAVISVIFYHANIYVFGKILFPGGFLGVDIFFVISGYLITFIILKEIKIFNNFSLINFYERRIRRIIPAFLFTILLSFPFAYLFLLPEAYIDFSKAAISSIFFISNIYFNFTGNQYGEEDVLFKPLIHTWSLSVEEQFYIFFPLSLIFLNRYLKKYISVFIILGILISISFAQYASFNHPGFNFYQIFSRIFELLLGSLLAYFQLYKKRLIFFHHNFYNVANKFAPAIGFFLIIYSIFFFNDRMLLPSFYSLFPLFGTCLIILFASKNDIVTKILSNKKLVFIGFISYSLYLFHYPIFAFARVQEIFDSSNIVKIFLIILILIISVFSYYFIEQPFRNKKFISYKNLLILIFLIVFLLLFLNIYVVKNEGIKNRLPPIFQKPLKKDSVDFLHINNLHKIVLIGDSHARALKYHLNADLEKMKISFYMFETPFFLKDFNHVIRKIKKNDTEFVKINNDINKILSENKNLIVILHHRWTIKLLETYFDDEEGFKEYKNELEKFSNYYEPIGILTSSQKERESYIIENLKIQINNIIQNGHKLILIYPVPEMSFDVSKKIYSQYKKKNLFFNDLEFKAEILSINYEVYKRRNKKIFEILDSFQNSEIYRIYPHEFFCNNIIKKRCVSNNEETFFYYDYDHLSLQGSKFVVDEIVKVISSIKN